jgi:hypothetical protein
MSVLTRNTLLVAIVIVTACSISLAADAIVTSGGVAATWPGSAGSYNIETGTFQGHANATMVAETDFSFGLWTAVPSSALAYTNVGTLVDPGFLPPAGPPPFACPGVGTPISVDGTNVACGVLLPGPFDDDASVAALFGIFPLAFEVTELTAGTSLVKSFVGFVGPVMGPSLTLFEDVDIYGRTTRHGPFAVTIPNRQAPPGRFRGVE